MAGGASGDGDEAITGINITPLVDIVLVLLIVFMVTAKLIVSKAVPLDLPKAATGTADIQSTLSIVLAADGACQVDSTLVASDDVILAKAKAAHEKNQDLRAVIKADAAVPHGRVIHVLDLLKQAQVSKIAFGVQPVAPGVPNTLVPNTLVPAPAVSR